VRSLLDRLPRLSELPHPSRLARFAPRAISLRTVAIVLMVAGALTFLVPVAIIGYGMWQESQLTQEWARGGPAQAASDTPGSIDPSRILPPFATPAPAAAPAPATPSAAPSIPALFAIRVPKIGYYAAVRQGVSLDVLAVGPGHYPTTAMPGKAGLVGIAAHNTFWIPFGQIGAGDTVVLETRSGSFTYRVTGTKIVNPDDRTVLVGTADPRLVLTTCWPLWAGNLAPQRLAIFAQQI
jgi:sortase A